MMTLTRLVFKEHARVLHTAYLSNFESPEFSLEGKCRVTLKVCVKTLECFFPWVVQCVMIVKFI